MPATGTASLHTERRQVLQEGKRKGRGSLTEKEREEGD